jgi:hypothetical protein
VIRDADRAAVPVVADVEFALGAAETLPPLALAPDRPHAGQGLRQMVLRVE